MYLGISYIIKNKEINKQMSSIGSAIVFSGATNYYFTNPIVALKVKQHLGKNNKKYNYKLMQLPEDIVSSKIYIKSYEDFLTHIEKQQKALLSTHEQSMDK